MTGAPSPEGAALAAALRKLRERTGLSLAALAAATTYSKSSWERYLNGKTLPPRDAVRELCRLAGEPDGHCLALRDIAESEWGGPVTEAQTPDPATASARTAATGTAAPLTTVSDPNTAVRTAGSDHSSGDDRAADPAASDVTRDPAAADREKGARTPAPGPDRAALPAVAAGHRPWAAIAVVAVLASVSALVLGALAFALLLVPRDEQGSPAPASQQVPGPFCRHASCEGEDPMAMKCAATPDTLTERRTSTGASVQLRYSRVCGTSWGRMWGARIGDRIEMTAAGRGDRARGARVWDRAEADTYVYTPMTVTRPGEVVRACFLPVAGGRKECFEAPTDLDPPRS